MWETAPNLLIMFERIKTSELRGIIEPLELQGYTVFDVFKGLPDQTPNKLKRTHDLFACKRFIESLSKTWSHRRHNFKKRRAGWFGNCPRYGLLHAQTRLSGKLSTIRTASHWQSSTYHYRRSVCATPQLFICLWQTIRSTDCRRGPTGRSRSNDPPSGCAIWADPPKQPLDRRPLRSIKSN